MSDTENMHHDGDSDDGRSSKRKRIRRRMTKKKLLKELEQKPKNFLTVSLPEEKLDEDKNVLITFYTKQQQ